MAARWEYNTGHYKYGGRQLDDVLADAGRDGWELVAINFDTYQLVFKRPGGA